MARTKKIEQPEWKEPVDLLDELGLVGESPQWMDAAELVCSVSRWVDIPVLLLAPSGSGKEGFARLAHAASGRKGPLITVNCNSLNPQTAQADLFGYEKGAFTGALKMKRGLIEEANGGTIFLDEGSDLDLNIQGMLLRFLQERTIMRFGGVKEIPVDVQVIFATWKNLKELCERREFRHDLLNRLADCPIRIPPLRDHLDDIPLLVSHFCQNDKPLIEAGLTLDNEALQALKNYHWPDNVRELRSILRRLVVSNTHQITRGQPWEAGVEHVRRVLEQSTSAVSWVPATSMAEPSGPETEIVVRIPARGRTERDKLIAIAVASAMRDQGYHTASDWVPLFHQSKYSIPVEGATQHAKTTRIGILLRKLEGKPINVDGRIYKVTRTYKWNLHKKPLYGLSETIG